jgi:hypothetical protein
MQLRARLLVLAAALLVPALAPAQDNTAAGSSLAGPTIEASVAAFRVTNVSSDSTSMLLQQRQSMGRPVALMIVGGAAILVGAVIGDAPGTLFMIGGAVALLYGLYEYTK